VRVECAVACRTMGRRRQRTGLVQGTLHMLILKTLALEPMHGYGIGVRSSRSARRVPGQRRVALSGAAPPGARRLIRGEWQGPRTTGRAKYYTLTAQGRAKLEGEDPRVGAADAAIRRICAPRWESSDGVAAPALVAWVCTALLRAARSYPDRETRTRSSRHAYLECCHRRKDPERSCRRTRRRSGPRGSRSEVWMP
jgi:hypothetical protein